MGTASSSALFGNTRSALLALFYGHADKSFYIRQLARTVGTGHGALQRELKALTDLGLILRSRQGNQVLYKANAKSPIFGEMKRLIAKTVGVHDAIRSALAPLASQINIAFVYGSIARQQERSSSDIDLMVLGEISFGEIVSALSGVQKTLAREINPTIYPVNEFKEKLAAGNHFLQTIMREKKLFVLGTEHELAKLAAKRMVG